MEIYTSYFANAKNFPDNMVPITICRSSPYWCSWINYNILAPTKSLLEKYKLDHDEVYYTFAFEKEVLSKLNAKEVVQQLEQIAGEKDGVILTCYEGPGKFCHRKLVAAWLSKYGYTVRELNTKKGLL